MKSQKSDYLKYWRVVRQYIKVKYNLTQADLEMLLFLKTEPYFTVDKFQEFNSVMSWEKKRFHRLHQEGWIEGSKTFRIGRRIRYNLSIRAQRMTTEVYNYLEGKELPISDQANPMFKRNVGYADKVYRNFIMNLRTKSKQQQRLAPE